MKKIFKTGMAFMLVASLALALIPLLGIADNEPTESVLDFTITISDSAPEADGVEYYASWVSGEGMEDSQQVYLTFPDEFFTRDGSLDTIIDDSDNLTGCTIPSPGDTVRCDADGIEENDEVWVEFEVTNPQKDADAGTADTYMIELATDGDTEGHTAQVAIIEPVVVTANIDATLNFEVLGVDAGEIDLHGDEESTVNTTSLPDLIDFGEINPDDGPYIAAQRLQVKTNATEGYTVTVFQDGDLESAAGDIISPFNNGSVVSPSNSVIWEGPDGILDNEETWGHFGYTTQDLHVSESCLENEEGYFYDETETLAKWAGFDEDNERTVMCYNGPVPDPGENDIENVNYTYVGYQVEVSQLQPAGYYNNTLTYIATPTF